MNATDSAETVRQILRTFPMAHADLSKCWLWFLTIPEGYVAMSAEIIGGVPCGEFHNLQKFFDEFGPCSEEDWAAFRFPAHRDAGPEDEKLADDQRRCFRVVTQVQRVQLRRRVCEYLNQLEIGATAIPQLHRELLRLFERYPVHARYLIEIIPAAHIEEIAGTFVDGAPEMGHVPKPGAAVGNIR